MKKIQSILKGTVICADIANIIKFIVNCDTSEELRHTFGDELDNDYDYDNMMVVSERIKKVYNKFREAYYEDAAAYLCAQTSLIGYFSATEELRKKLPDFDIYFKLGISKKDVDEYVRFLGE